MLATENFGLKMPQDSDPLDQLVFNYNSDILDKKLNQGQQAIAIVDILMAGSNLVDENGNTIVDENSNYIVS